MVKIAAIVITIVVAAAFAGLGVQRYVLDANPSPTANEITINLPDHGPTEKLTLPVGTDQPAARLKINGIASWNTTVSLAASGKTRTGTDAVAMPPLRIT